MVFSCGYGVCDGLWLFVVVTFAVSCGGSCLLLDFQNYVFVVIIHFCVYFPRYKIFLMIKPTL